MEDRINYSVRTKKECRVSMETPNVIIAEVVTPGHYVTITYRELPEEGPFRHLEIKDYDLKNLIRALQKLDDGLREAALREVGDA